MDFRMDFQKDFQKNFQRTSKRTFQREPINKTFLGGALQNNKKMGLKVAHSTKTVIVFRVRPFFTRLVQKARARIVLFSRDAAAGEGAGGAGEGTKTCLDTPNDLPPARTHAPQRKHKHETRFPGWRCHKGLTPPTSDVQTCSRVLAIERSYYDFLLLLLGTFRNCLLYTSPSPRDKRQSRMPSSA